MFKFTLSKKISLVSAILIIFILILSGISIWGMSLIDKVLNNVTDVTAPTVETGDDLIMALWEANKVAEEYLIEEDITKLAPLEEEFFSLVESYKEADAELDTLVGTDQEFADELTGADIEFQEFVKNAKEMFELHKIELEKEINVKNLVQHFEQLADDLGKILGEAAQKNENEFKESQNIQDYDAVEAAMKLDILVGDALETAREYLSEEDPQKLPAIRAEFEAITEGSNIYEQQLLNSVTLAEETTQVQEIINLIKSFEESTTEEDELFDEYQEQLEAEYNAKDKIEQLETDVDRAVEYLDNLVSLADKVSDDTDEQAAATIGNIRMLLIGVALMATLIGCSASFVIARKITVPTQELVRILNEMAKGNFDHHVVIKGSDEIATLGTSFNLMIQNLKKQIELTTQIANGNLSQQVQLASDQDDLGLALQRMTESLNQTIAHVSLMSSQVTEKSQELSHSSERFSQGATQQATALEEISSSMEEINSQTQGNAKNAIEANTLARTAQEKAETGNQQMQNLLAAMKEIQDASQSISAIIKTIDEIAFQTNVLAINAAVEAARAGVHGKGFAVVAEEVRSLAQRSADAAKETASIITNSVQKTEEGSRSMEASAVSLQEIVSGVKQVTSLVQEISTSSEHQAKGVVEINTGLQRLNDVTQQNASLSTEVSRASEELTGQATELKHQIANFQLQEQIGQTLKTSLNTHQITFVPDSNG